MKRSILWLFALLALSLGAAAPLRAQSGGAQRPFLSGPIWVYNNWSSYDELSDDVALTEAAAMREVGQVLRLRRLGVHIDYYVMDAFWYDPNGGYRKWRSEGWPDGPERWLGTLERNGILPGLWFSTNTLAHLYAAPAWQSSLTTHRGAMALYTGGFLPDFMDVLQYWYDRGVRLFKFDFAELAAAAAGDETKFSPAEIRERNTLALRAALLDFRARNPDVVLVAFNGFDGDFDTTAAPMPFHDPVDPRWLDVFDSLYAGDPRASDVPDFSFWRAMDVYSDHTVRRFAANGVPLRRIDFDLVHGGRYRHQLPSQDQRLEGNAAFGNGARRLGQYRARQSRIAERRRRALVRARAKALRAAAAGRNDDDVRRRAGRGARLRLRLGSQ